MRQILKSVLFVSAVFLANSAFAQVDFCDVFGSVFITSTKTQAHYSVYIEESDAFADVLIFKEENELYADQQGKWYVVNDRAFADYRIYVTKNRREADFSIYYIDTESFAGCNN